MSLGLRWGWLWAAVACLLSPAAMGQDDATGATLDALDDVGNLRSGGCRRAFGLAMGAYHGGRDWDTVGGAPWEPTISPSFAAACSRPGGAVVPWLGFESAPWYVQVRPNDDQVRQVASASVGVLIGSDSFQIGPLATAGFSALGAGLTMLWVPDGADAGLEVRVTAHQLGATGVQAMLMYTTTPKWIAGP